MAALTEERVRVIFKEELSGSPDVVGLKSDVGQLKSDVGQLKVEVMRLGVQFEAFDAKMDAIAELVHTTIETRTDVRELKDRVEVLEGDVGVLKTAVRR